MTNIDVPWNDRLDKRWMLRTKDCQSGELVFLFILGFPFMPPILNKVNAPYETTEYYLFPSDQFIIFHVQD